MNAATLTMLVDALSADGPAKDLAIDIQREAWRLRKARQREIWRRRPLSDQVKQAVISRDGLRCGLCGEAVPPDDVHIDHVQPVSKGGNDDPDNLQVSHALCNMRKGNRTA